MDNPFASGLRAGFTPKPRVALSKWAEENIVLPAARSASPGPFRIGEAAFQRGMMDIITDPDIETVVFMTSSQVGKSTILAAAEAYYAAHEPSPQLSVFPTQIAADNYVNESFDPMMDASPTMRATFKRGGKHKQKDDHKSYPGGYIAFVGANNPTQLAARPIRVAKGDEVDRFPLSSSKEGSPVTLMFRRTQTFPNRKRILASTPVMKKTSQIWHYFGLSDQRFFFVVCDTCDHKQALVWKNVIYKPGDEENAHYACEHCGELWTNRRKQRLVAEAESRGGGWQATKPFGGIVGFHVSALYSPFSSIGEIAAEYESAHGRPEHEQTFYNTVLGLPYEGEVSSFADPEALLSRREPYTQELLPKLAAFITGAVDVQDDRLEVLFQAWGPADESWVIEHVTIPRDPSTGAAWAELEIMLQKTFPHPSGAKLQAWAVAIDSGGHYTQNVYAFATKHRNRRWHAIKGVTGEKKPIWQLSKTMPKKGVHLYLVGVDDAKTTVYKRYAITKPGPGYVHLPESITEAQVKQMTAEYVEIDYVKGFPKRTWTKDRNDRNEMLDLMVYAYAARCSLNVRAEDLLMRYYAPQEDTVGSMYQLGRIMKELAA